MEWYLYVLIFLSSMLVEAGIWWLIDKFSDRRAEKRRAQQEQVLPNIPREEKIALLKYNDLTWRKEKLLHLYYNKDETKRLLFFRYKDYITVVKERLNIFDEEDLTFASCYGFWEEDDDYHHIYDSLETALNEWQRELTHYKEEPLPLPSSNEETIKFMD